MGDKVAAEAVDKFEDMLPRYKGLVPRTFSDVTTFIVFFCMVLYVFFRMFRFGFGLMCCVFCPCFLCRKRKKLQAVPGGKSEKRMNRGVRNVRFGLSSVHGTELPVSRPSGPEQ